MGNTSLTNMATTFLAVTLIFSVFLSAYVNMGVNGYDVSDFDNGSIEDLADKQRSEQYLEDVGEGVDGLQGDNSLADVIGNLINVALAPVRIILNGINFMITGVGSMINVIIPGSSLFTDFVTGVMTLSMLSIFLFAVVLGRRDKID